MKSTSLARRPFWRRRNFWLGGLLALALLLGARALWNPGLTIRDGSHDRARNAIWIGHGWLGADSWFDSNQKKARFRSVQNIAALAQLCRENNIRDLYPHLTPTQDDGAMSDWDDSQVERFLDGTKELRVLPWVGGRRGTHIEPSDPAKTARFAVSAGDLFKKHPRLAGVHLNVEPWHSGDAAMLKLLEQLRAALPPGKILSVAAYTPSVPFNPFKITWTRNYIEAVAARCDQMAFMLYDSSIHDRKIYQWFYARWTQTLLDWTRGTKTEVVFGVPTYGAAGPKLGPVYHNPRVENLSNALRGLHRGLADYGALPPHYAGAAIYCEWETEAAEWQLWREEFRSR